MKRRSLQLSKLSGHVLSVAALVSGLSACTPRPNWPGVQINTSSVAGIPSITTVQPQPLALTEQGNSYHPRNPRAPRVFMVSPAPRWAGQQAPPLVQHAVPVTTRPQFVYASQQAPPMHYPMQVRMHQRYYPPMGLPPEPVITGNRKYRTAVVMPLPYSRPVPSSKARYVPRNVPRNAPITVQRVLPGQRMPPIAGYKQLFNQSNRKHHAQTAQNPMVKPVKKQDQAMPFINKHTFSSLIKPQVTDETQPRTPGITPIPIRKQQTNIKTVLNPPTTMQAEARSIPQGQPTDETQGEVFRFMIEEKNLPIPQPKMVVPPQPQSQLRSQPPARSQPQAWPRSQNRQEPASNIGAGVPADIFPLIINKHYLQVPTTAAPRKRPPPANPMVHESYQHATEEPLLHVAQLMSYQDVKKPQLNMAQYAQIDVLPIMIEENTQSATQNWQPAIPRNQPLRKSDYPTAIVSAQVAWVPQHEW